MPKQTKAHPSQLMIQDRSLALEALTRFVSAVNNTGGVLIHPEKNITGCAADPDWLDLADAYCLACGALGEEPKTQPDPQFAMPLAKDKPRAGVHYNLPDLLAAMEVDPITPEAQENLGLWIATGCQLFLAIDGAKDARLIHSAYKEFELTKARRHARKLNSCTPRLFRLGFLNNRPQIYKV